MPPKPAPRKWTDVQLAIATVAMTSVLGFWNMFAGPDREKAAQKAQLEQTKVVPTPTATEMPTATEIPATMPPPGFTIIYGGEAPKPQVIVQKHHGGGGGDNGGSGGGAGNSSGGGGAVTSSGSS